MKNELVRIYREYYFERAVFAESMMKMFKAKKDFDMFLFWKKALTGFKLRYAKALKGELV